MKILVVTDFSSVKPGGAQLIAEKLTKVLTAAGNTCKITTYPVPKNSILSKFRELSLVREIRSLVNPYGIARIILLQLMFKPDVLWYHNINNEWSWSILGIRIRKSKRLITLHDLTAISNRKLNSLEFQSFLEGSRFNYRKMRAFLVKLMMRGVITVSIGRTCKEALVGMGFRIDAQIFNRVEACTHSEPVNKIPKTVLFAGRSYLKGVDLVARAVALQEGWSMLIASDEEAYRLALEFCPAERIVYLGVIPRRELLQLIHSVELVAVCSQYLDNYPTIGLEALVHGSIPFTTSSTGLMQVLDPISPDLVLPPGQIPDLDKILDIGNSAKDRRLLAAESASDIDAMIQDYLTLIESEVIAQSPNQHF